MKGWIFGQVPQAPAMGNHTYFYQGQWQNSPAKQWRQHFTRPTNGLAELPETNNDFVSQNLLFVMLNGNTQREAQAEWLDDLLSREKTQWIFHSVHQPLYSTKKGGDGIKMRGREEEQHVPLDCLKRLEDLHDEWLLNDSDTIVLDGTRHWSTAEVEKLLNP